MEEPRHQIAALMTGLDIHYELGEGHPLLGRRMPDLKLTATAGALCVYELLHDAVLVRLDGYVGWVGCGAQQGLRPALTTWFGPPPAT